MLKREEKMLNEFESWCCSPCNTDHASKFAWNAWQAACASKQKEIDHLRSIFRVNILRLAPDLSHDEIDRVLNGDQRQESQPAEPTEVYSPHTKVIE